MASMGVARVRYRPFVAHEGNKSLAALQSHVRPNLDKPRRKERLESVVFVVV